MLIRCFSADHFAGAAPPRVSEEAREHATQAVGEVDGRMLPPRHVDRPPYEEWFANDLVSREESPEATVVTSISIVSENEKVTRRYSDRPIVVARTQISSGRLLENCVRFIERRPIDEDLFLQDLDRFTGQNHHPFDVIGGFGTGLQVFEHDDILPYDFGERKEPNGLLASVPPKRELVDEEVIARQQGVLHASGRDLHRLSQEGSNEKNHHYRKKKRFEVLAEGRLAAHQSAESLAVRLWKINATRVRAKPSPATREERKYASA